MKIVLDTNFLISCLKFKIDFLGELSSDQLFIVDKTKQELESLKKAIRKITNIGFSGLLPK